MSDVLTVTELADEWKTSQAFVRGLIKAGKLQARRVGPIWVIPRTEADRYVSEVS